MYVPQHAPGFLEGTTLRGSPRRRDRGPGTMPGSGSGSGDPAGLEGMLCGLVNFLAVRSLVFICVLFDTVRSLDFVLFSPPFSYPLSLIQPLPVSTARGGDRIFIGTMVFVAPRFSFYLFPSISKPSRLAKPLCRRCSDKGGGRELAFNSESASLFVLSELALLRS